MGRCIIAHLGVKHRDIYILFSGLAKGKCMEEGRSSLYYPFDFSVGLKFYNNNNNNNNNKPMKVYQELQICRNETDKWMGKQAQGEHSRNRKQYVQRLGRKREPTFRNCKSVNISEKIVKFGGRKELWRVIGYRDGKINEFINLLK